MVEREDSCRLRRSWQGTLHGRSTDARCRPSDVFNLCASIADPQLSTEWLSDHSEALLAFAGVSKQHQPLLCKSPRLQRTLLAGLAHSIQLAAAALSPARCAAEAQAGPASSSQLCLDLWWVLALSVATLVEAEWVPAAVQRASQQGSGMGQLLQTLCHWSFAPLVELDSCQSPEQLQAITEQQLTARLQLQQAAFAVMMALQHSLGTGPSNHPTAQDLAATALQLVREAVNATRKLLDEQPGLQQFPVEAPEKLPEGTLATLCHGRLVAALLHLADTAQRVTAVQLPACASAVQAAVRLLPLLSRLHALHPDTCQSILEQLINLLLLMASFLKQQDGEPCNPATAAQLLSAHTLSCRMVHAGGRATPEQLQDLPVLGDNAALFCLLAACYKAARTAVHGR